ncbi:hypothetical protein AAHB65_29260 [Bacillus toyonensis]
MYRKFITGIFYSLGLLLYQTGFDPISPNTWLNYLDGDIVQHDIDCRHKDLCQPGPLTEIGQVLAKYLQNKKGVNRV